MGSGTKTTSEYLSRSLVHMGAEGPSHPEGLSADWRRLAADLLSPAYRRALARLTGRDLAWVITQVRSMLPLRNFPYHTDGLGGQPEAHGLELVRVLSLNASGHGPPSPKPCASAGCQGEGQAVCRGAGGPVARPAPVLARDCGRAVGGNMAAGFSRSRSRRGAFSDLKAGTRRWGRSRSASLRSRSSWSAADQVAPVRRAKECEETRGEADQDRRT